MILLPNATSLSGIERHGLDLLVDLSRLLPVSAGVTDDPVRLAVTDRTPDALGLRECVSRDWYLERSDGVVTVPRAVLGVIGAVSGAVAEQRSTARDRHGRVPPSENPLVAGGLERQAVVSRAGKTLRESASAVAERRPFRLIAPWPDGRRWATAMTHDLDLVAWWPLAVLARVAELGRKGKVKLALRAVARGVGSIGRDPVWRAVQAVLRQEAEFSARSTWFILSETPSFASFLAGDVTYRPESAAARRILRDLTARGCELGLHGSFATAEGEGVFERQRDRLAGLSAARLVGVRQHFLRMRPGLTQARMCAAGFHYDSTFGFADRNGFRLGVADVLPLWDAANGRAAGIDEAPFCWMDRALSKYRAIEDAEVWVDDGLALAAECRAVDGLWVGVWHPNVHPALGFHGAKEAFERLLGDIAAEHPFLASLSTMVRWRAARRSVRASGVGASGQVEAVVKDSGGFVLYLEDAKGHRLEAVRSVTS